MNRGMTGTETDDEGGEEAEEAEEAEAEEVGDEAEAEDDEDGSERSSCMTCTATRLHEFEPGPSHRDIKASYTKYWYEGLPCACHTSISVRCNTAGKEK